MPGNAKSKDNATEKWGCAILIVAVVLFAIQRFVLFVILYQLSAAGSGSASQVLGFLFGEPPHSIFNIILGFPIPDEGLFFLLQPYNLLLGFVQAVHGGINFGIAYALFWLIEQVRLATIGRPWLRFGGCFGALVLLAALAIGIITCGGSNLSSLTTGESSGTPPLTDLESYSNPTAGVSFEFPAYMELQADIQKERGLSSQVITITNISASSRDPVVGILIHIIEDPLRNQMFPKLYPPSDQSLRILVAGEITNLNYPKTETNNSEAMAASDNATIMTISGFRAASYKVGLEGSSLGHVYIRGAIIVTDRRDISLYIIGSDELDVSGSVNSDYIDTLWSKLLESFSVDF